MATGISPAKRAEMERYVTKSGRPAHSSSSLQQAALAMLQEKGLSATPAALAARRREIAGSNDYSAILEKYARH